MQNALISSSTSRAFRELMETQKVKSLTAEIEETGDLKFTVWAGGKEHELEEGELSGFVKALSPSAPFGYGGAPTKPEPLEDKTWPEFVSAMLRKTVEAYGGHAEIYLGPLVRVLEPYAEKRGIRREEIIAAFEEEGLAKTATRRAGSEARSYTVLILEEEHPEVKAIREETDIYYS